MMCNGNHLGSCGGILESIITDDDPILFCMEYMSIGTFIFPLRLA